MLSCSLKYKRRHRQGLLSSCLGQGAWGGPTQQASPLTLGCQHRGFHLATAPHPTPWAFRSSSRGAWGGDLQRPKLGAGSSPRVPAPAAAVTAALPGWGGRRERGLRAPLLLARHLGPGVEPHAPDVLRLAVSLMGTDPQPRRQKGAELQALTRRSG